MQTVSIQGKRHSFHDVAQQQFFAERPADALLYRDSFADVFADVAVNQAAFGVVAIENSVFGPIDEVETLLQQYKAKIIGQTSLQVSFSLFGVPGASLEDIKNVYSHSVALGQCGEFLSDALPQAEIIEHADTAGSVADVVVWNNPKSAAIASQTAGNAYGATLLAENIGDNPESITRFVVFQKT